MYPESGRGDDCLDRLGFRFRVSGLGTRVYPESGRGDECLAGVPLTC